ncbi:MAG TPA: hypothetical protein VMV05_01295 [bacterium]|nr:hypothetical protein [bacterium]
MTPIPAPPTGGHGKTLRSLGLAALVAGLAFSTDSLAGSANGGSVSGTLRVKKTRVEIQGPKSDKDVVVYLLAQSQAAVPPPAVHAQMDQVNLNFVPHVLAIQKGTTVDFLNHDKVNHNVSSPAICCAFDLGYWGQGGVKSRKFDTVAVVPLVCSFHPEMAASIVVLDTPYFTTSALAEAKDGKQSAKYLIQGVAPGDYTLKVWNGKLLAAEQKVRVAGSGKVTVDVDLRKK